jgi:ribonuclease E
LAPVRFEPSPEDEEDVAAAEAEAGDGISETGGGEDGEAPQAPEEAEDRLEEARGEVRGDGGGRRRRRRRRRPRKDDEQADHARVNGSASLPLEPQDQDILGDHDAFNGGEHEVALLGDDETLGEAPTGEARAAGESSESGERRRRRRGRRGGRRNRGRDGGGSAEAPPSDEMSADAAEPMYDEASEIAPGADEATLMESIELAAELQGDELHHVEMVPAAENLTASAPSAEPPAPQDLTPIALPEPEAVDLLVPPAPTEPEKPAEPPRKGWWQRRFGG